MLDQKQCCLVLSVLILILIFLNITRMYENKIDENKVEDNINSMKNQIDSHNEQIKEGKKVNTILSNMLKEDGDVPTQGRMLNQIIADSNIERSKWARDF